MTPVYSSVTAPGEEPVTLAEAAAQVRQDSTADDAYLIRCIKAARASIEKQFNLYICTQTVDAHFPGFPRDNYFKINRGPLVSVSSVQYVTSSDQTLTFAATNYDVSTHRQQIVLKYAATWPLATLRPLDPVTVRCVMGYGGAAVVPENVKQAILLRIGHLYAHREEITLGAIAIESKALMVGVDHLMAPERRYNA
jgi:uncharacterized phiE125 gp8 family phage protein